MSQAKRSHVVAASKWREQVAREIAGQVELYWNTGHICQSLGWESAMRAMLGRYDGELNAIRFDVHAAREHAATLIALEDERRVFEDWTRAKGLGPENRGPGAFDPRECSTCRGSGKYWTHFTNPWPRADMALGGRGGTGRWVQCHCEGDGLKCGGWPGKLARQYADEQTYGCCGAWRTGVFVHDPGPCTKCEERHRRHSRAPMGRAFARLGRRILDALDGQPSECQAVACVGRRVVSTHGTPGKPFVLEGTWDLPRDHHGQVNSDGTFEIIHQCRDCHGTGHNLRGVLPPVEWSAQARRKAREAGNYADGAHRNRPWRTDDRAGHLAAPYEAGRESGWTLKRWDAKKGEVVNDVRTRTVAKGQHRDAREPLTYPRHGGTVMRCQVDSDGYIDDGRAFALLPRWRRGELRHAEQRRGRARARDPIAAAARAMQPMADEFARRSQELGRAAERAGSAIRSMSEALADPMQEHADADLV